MLLQLRPRDLVRVYVQKEKVQRYASLLKVTSQLRLAYHLVEEDELQKISESSHHEGICILGKRKAPLAEKNFWERISSQEATNRPLMLPYLDGVENPHNLGAFFRTAVHFGANLVLSGPEFPKPTPSLYRVSEGAAEWVDICRVNPPLKAIQELKEKHQFEIIATAADGEGVQSLNDFRFFPKTLLILGSESQGISKEMLRMSDRRVKIPGTGRVESLNVNVAGAILLSEYFRQYPEASKTI
jgi:TrmH RNA methyltransferase